MSHPVTANDFLMRLKQRVSDYNAKLMLHSAMLEAGVSCPHDTILSEQQFDNLCLGLIKAGGPAFQVGQAMYKESRTPVQH